VAVIAYGDILVGKIWSIVYFTWFKFSVISVPLWVKIVDLNKSGLNRRSWYNRHPGRSLSIRSVRTRSTRTVTPQATERASPRVVSAKAWRSW